MDTMKMQDERQVTFATPDVTLKSRRQQNTHNQNAISSDDENTRRGISAKNSSDMRVTEMTKKASSQRDLHI